MKSIAPFFIVDTAIGTSPWPVMKTTGSVTLARDQFVLQFQAAHALHADVDDRAGDRSRGSYPARKVSAVSKPMTR